MNHSKITSTQSREFQEFSAKNDCDLPELFKQWAVENKNTDLKKAELFQMQFALGNYPSYLGTPLGNRSIHFQDSSR